MFFIDKLKTLRRWLSQFFHQPKGQHVDPIELDIKYKGSVQGWFALWHLGIPEDQVAADLQEILEAVKKIYTPPQ